MMKKPKKLSADWQRHMTKGRICSSMCIIRTEMLLNTNIFLEEKKEQSRSGNSLFSAETAAAGAYSICTGVAARLNSLASSATLVLVPFASSYQAHGKNTEVAKIYFHLLRLIGCLLAAAGIFLILWSKWLLSIWISPQFSLSYSRVFGILILAYTLFSMSAPGYHIAFGLGRPEVPAIITVGGALIMLVCIGILSPTWGLPGAAVANLSYAVAILINFYAARELGPKAFSPVFKAIGPPIMILFLPLMIIPFVKFNLVSLIIINLVSLALLVWLALNEGRIHFVLKAIKWT